MAVSRLPFSRLAKPLMPALAFTLVAMAALALIPGATLAESTVHGRVYDWSTFKVVSPVIITVNTTPEQKIVSGDGNYSLDLPEGNYGIKAEARTDDGVLSATENVTVQGSGDFTIDLLLFPVTDLSTLEALNESLPVSAPEAAPAQEPWQALFVAAAAMAATVLLILAAAGAYITFRGRKPKTVAAEPGEPAAAKPVEAPGPAPAANERVLRQDCIDVLKAIEKSGGRMTQMDLRKSVPYSEVRISLIVSDLEDAGLLRKVKKGRGNILILTGAGDEPVKADASPDDKKS